MIVIERGPPFQPIPKLFRTRLDGRIATNVCWLWFGVSYYPGLTQQRLVEIIGEGNVEYVRGSR